MKKNNPYIDICVVCNEGFLLSDPKTFYISDKKCFCKNCFLKIGEKTRWNSEVKKVVKFEYIKENIPHRLKWKIWERDGFKCKICKSEQNLSLDHIQPESLGGTLDEDNIQTLCRSCNSKKYNKVYG